MLQSLRQLRKALMLFRAIKQYCKQRRISCKISNLFDTIKISLNLSSLYFIIVPQKINYKTKVKHLRKKEATAQVVLLTSEIDYQYLFEHHLELLGVIDLSANYNFSHLVEIAQDYIDTFIKKQAKNN